MRARSRFATEYETLPATSRRTGVGLKTLRAAGARGEFPVYRVTKWPRVRRTEIDDWISSHRVRVGAEHARRVVDHVLDREARRP